MTGTHISLFSGVGMIDAAATSLGFKTVATAEIDEWNRKVLKARLPDVPSERHFSDVRDVKFGHAGLWGATLSRPLLVSGGFPCQDLSVAGHGKGLAGDRSGLWTEFARIIGEFKPEYVLIENVAVLRSRGLNAVLWDLDRLGYNVRWDCIPAAACGAPHLRDRIWIAAIRRDHQDAGTFVANLPAVKVLGSIRNGMGKGKQRMPRAGIMVHGLLNETRPVATQKQAREAVTKDGKVLLPTPTKQDGANNGGPAQYRRNSLPLNAYVKLYPTPRHAPNEWRTTKNAPSHGVTHGATLAGTINDEERAAGLTPAPSSESAGNLSPRWVEWLMGLPENWTDPDVPNAQLSPFEGWVTEPRPRTEGNAKDRRKRLMALGNGAVPQAAAVALSFLLPEAQEA